MNAQWSFHSAPCSTHRLSRSISCGVSVRPSDFGGIRSPSSSAVIRATSSLSSRFPGTMARPSDFELGEGPFLRVEPQPGLAVPGVGPVAVEALVRKDGPDLVVEVDILRGRRFAGTRGKRGQENQGNRT